MIALVKKSPEPKAANLSFWLKDEETGFSWKVEREILAGQQIDWEKMVAEEMDKYRYYKENKAELDEKFGEYGAWYKYEERRGNSGGQERVQSKNNDL